MRRASAATDAEDLSPLEKSVFEELNFARTQPKELAKHLLAMRPHFDGKIMKLPGREAAVQGGDQAPSDRCSTPTVPEGLGRHVAGGSRSRERLRPAWLDWARRHGRLNALEPPVAAR